MAAIVLGNLRTGIDRTRRFALTEVDRLWSLRNAYVNDAGRVVMRPGFDGQPSGGTGCRGLYGFRGKLHRFSAVPVANPNPSLFVINVLRHPTNGAAGLHRIHFVGMILGSIYVVAEFTDGVVKHYWLQPVTQWASNLKVELRQFIKPTNYVGYVYEITSGPTINAWAANTTYAVGAQVQPTAYNTFYYEVMARTGTNPKSSDAEPDWPETVGNQVIEVRLLAGAPDTTPSVTPRPPAAPPPTPPYQPNPETRISRGLNRLP